VREGGRGPTLKKKNALFWALVTVACFSCKGLDFGPKEEKNPPWICICKGSIRISIFEMVST